MATHGTATHTRANDHTHRERSIAGVCDAAGASTWARRASFVTMLGDSRATATATAACALRASSSSTAPTVALTVGLTRTYQGINARYYERLECRRRLSEEDARYGREGRAMTTERELTNATDGAMGPRRVTFMDTSARRAEDGASGSGSGSGSGSSHLGAKRVNNAHAAPRELINDRYLLDKVLGRGSFGKVVLAYDLREDKHVAIKVVERSARNDVAVAQEIALLREINGSCGGGGSEASGMSCDNDMDDDFSFLLPTSGKENCVRLLDAFEHDVDRSSPDGRERLAYQCLVFDLMSHSLYDLLRVTNLGGVSIKLVRKFGVQILHALAYLKSQNIIHCDVKPENVLLCHPERSAVKIIDFGSACKVGKQQFSYVQSRFYRAPEVMLGMKYGSAIDMWSLGCMLYELRTGKPLFTGRSEHDQLFKIENTIGRISQKTLKKIPEEYRERYFESDGRMKPSPEALRAAQSSGLALPEPSSRPVGRVLLQELVRAGSIYSPQSSNSLDEMTDSDGAFLERRRERRTGVDDGEPDDEHHVFLSLLNRMLIYDPDDRITPEQALAHPFFYSIEHNTRPIEALVRRSMDRLPSIPNMDTVTELNAREAAQGALGGIGERFTFMGQARKHSGNSFAC